jgi:capsule biosynthesis phosphatase
MKRTYIIDIDGTICQAEKQADGSYDYPNAAPLTSVIQRIQELYKEGNEIVLFTSRGMRTYAGNLEEITKHVQPVLEEWLKRYDVPYNRLIMGKPWGTNVIYVDNRNLSLKSFTHSNPEFFENIINAENLI